MKNRGDIPELVIIGGGAAGLFAAAVAAERGLKALLVERKARCGAKMLMTANGRCNFTKDISPAKMLSDIGGEAAEFLKPAFSAMPPAKIASAFAALGLRIRKMEDGRLFPASGTAADVVHVFGDFLRDKSFPTLVNSPVVSLETENGVFMVGCRNFSMPARNVLLATGGRSFPKTGSTGDGHEFARSLSHRIVPCRAGLTGFNTNEFVARAGTKWERSVARIEVDGKCLYEWSGETEFEKTGVTGAAVYNCQRFAAHAGLRNFRFRVVSSEGEFSLCNPVARSVKEAIVTIGGVSLDEVNPETMESRLVPGLYFAGEILDVDGPTGGYNLSIAFATARLAVLGVIGRVGYGALRG